METLVANLVGKTRRERWLGRDYLVAPLTLIVPGVLPGSKGPLYYPPDEVAREPDSWNHVPIVVYHPTLNGTPTTARRPDVLERQGVGYVFNAGFKGKLRAEGWFDIERTKVVDPRVLTALEAGNPFELSTGLYTDNEPAPGGSVFNSASGPRPYTYIARNYRPDHLAVLPDRKGACSVADGCGVLVNEAGVYILDLDLDLGPVLTSEPAANAALAGGKWITLHGSPVYIKDGKVIGGAAHLRGVYVKEKTIPTNKTGTKSATVEKASPPVVKTGPNPEPKKAPSSPTPAHPVAVVPTGWAKFLHRVKTGLKAGLVAFSRGQTYKAKIPSHQATKAIEKATAKPEGKPVVKPVEKGTAGTVEKPAVGAVEKTVAKSEESPAVKAQNQADRAVIDFYGKHARELLAGAHRLDEGAIKTYTEHLDKHLTREQVVGLARHIDARHEKVKHDPVAEDASKSYAIEAIKHTIERYSRGGALFNESDVLGYQLVINEAEEEAASLYFTDLNLLTANAFDPNQPRDSSGKWATVAEAKKAVGEARGRVSKAQAALEKAKAALKLEKDGLLVAKRGLEEAKGREKARSPAAQKAIEKAKAGGVDAHATGKRLQELAGTLAARVGRQGNNAADLQAEGRAEVEKSLAGIKSKVHAAALAEGFGIKPAKTVKETKATIARHVEARIGSSARVGLANRPEHTEAEKPKPSKSREDSAPNFYTLARSTQQANDRLTNKGTGLTPVIPRLYEEVKKDHPGLTEPAFHEHLRELERRDLAVLQTWETTAHIEPATGYPSSRFPIGGRFGGAPQAWVQFRPEAVSQIRAEAARAKPSKTEVADEGKGRGDRSGVGKAQTTKADTPVKLLNDHIEKTKGLLAEALHVDPAKVKAHVDQMAKDLNKDQVLQVAKSVDLHGLKTKKDALKNIHDTIVSQNSSKANPQAGQKADETTTGPKGASGRAPAYTRKQGKDLPNEPAVRKSLPAAVAEAMAKNRAGFPILADLYDSLKNKHPDLTLPGFHKQLLSWSNKDYVTLLANNDPRFLTPRELSHSVDIEDKVGSTTRMRLHSWMHPTLRLPK